MIEKGSSGINSQLIEAAEAAMDGGVVTQGATPVTMVDDVVLMELAFDATAADVEAALDRTGLDWRESLDGAPVAITETTTLSGITRTFIGGYLPVELVTLLPDLFRGREDAGTFLTAEPIYVSTGTGSVVSQGDEAQRSDEARAEFGVDGTGVVVGVLSDSFASNQRPDGSPTVTTAAQDLASGDIPDVLVLSDALPISPFGDEGRAMIQLIHDVAPGAEIAFHTALNGQGAFANGILSLRADESVGGAGADIIVDDIVYFAEPIFQDGVIAQAVQTVVDDGAVYFSSAGNNSDDAFRDTFNDSGIDGSTITALNEALGGALGNLHDWNPDEAVFSPYVELTIGDGENFTISFQWDEAYISAGGSGSTADFDIFLTEVVDGVETVVSFGFSNNIGSNPIEFIDYANSNGEATQVRLYITEFDASDEVAANQFAGIFFSSESGTLTESFNPRILDDTETPSIAAPQFDAPTVFGHANAAGALAVGAAAFFNTPEFNEFLDSARLNSFSSEAGYDILFDAFGNRLETPEVRGPVDFVAPDGGNTTFFGVDSGADTDSFGNFFGTSASAPHAAAVAALLLEVDPTLSPDGIEGLLESTASPIVLDNFGRPVDEAFVGAGLIDAVLAIEAAIDALPNDDLLIAQEPLTTLSGGAGNDTAVGNSGDLLADGGNGDDLIYAGLGNNVVDGDQGEDTLLSGAGPTTLTGGDDADVFGVIPDSGPASVTITDFLTGVDSLFILGSDISIVSLVDTDVNADTVLDTRITASDGSTVELLSVSGLNIADLASTASPFGEGSTGADTFTGRSRDDLIVALGGDDVLNPSNGDDVVFSGSGNDTVLGSNDNDLVFGFEGDDRLIGGNDLDTLVGGIGNDTLEGGNGVDSLFGGPGDDVFIANGTGGAGDDYVGGAGTDIIQEQGLNGNIIINSTARFDSIELIVVRTNGQLRGTGADDVLDLAEVGSVQDATGNLAATVGAAGNDTISGTPSDDIIEGEIGDDSLFGADGNDFLNGGVDDDTLRGGSGNDTLLGSSGANLLDGQADDDTFIVNGTQGSSDRFIGGGGFDVIVELNLNGTLTFNTQTSFEDIDEIRLGNGEQVHGTGQDDVLDFSDVDAVVTVNGDAAIIDSRNGDDTVFGTSTDDFITGNDGDDSLIGAGGDDILRGEDGNDTLLGGIGNDTLRGDAGADSLSGGADDDVFIVSGSDGVGDIFDGGDGTNRIEELGLNGRLIFGTGTEFLSIGAIVVGNEREIRGTETADILDFSDVGSIEQANGDLASIFARDGDDSIIGTNSADIIFGENGDDTLAGNSGDDTIFGGEGDDALNGGAGADRLFGVSGNNTLTGGADNDVFEVRNRAATTTITDFDQDGDDRIDVSTFSAFSSFADIQDIASQQGSDTHINLDNNDTLILLGVDLLGLSEADFIFGG